MKKTRSLGSKRLEEIAKAATRAALEGYEIPSDVRRDLALSEFIEKETRTFMLYIPSDRPEDARVITKVTVNAATGEAGPVEVFLPKRVGVVPEDPSK